MFLKDLGIHVHNLGMIVFSLQSYLRWLVSLENAFQPTCQNCQQSPARQNHHRSIVKHFVLQKTRSVALTSHIICSKNSYTQHPLQGWA